MSNKSTLIKIFALMAFVLLSVVVVLVAVILSYTFAINNTAYAARGQISSGNNSHAEDEEELPPQAPADINFLLLGIDNHNLSDVMLIAHFSGERGTLDIVSLPRDARLQFSDAERAELAERGVRNISTGTFLANSLVGRSGGRTPAGLEFAKAHLGELFGLEIDHYIVMHLDGFRDIVDAVGGVHMYVPQNLVYRGIWIDDGEGGGRWDRGEIDVNIQRGWNHLDGRHAEQLVRFRNTPRGDFFRIEMQQLFMQAFFEQALTLEGLTNNPLALITSFITHVDTDIGVPALSGFIQDGMIEALDAEAVNFHTLPLVRSGRYYFIDMDVMQQIMQDIQEPPEFEDEEEDEYDDDEDEG